MNTSVKDIYLKPKTPIAVLQHVLLNVEKVKASINESFINNKITEQDGVDELIGKMDVGCHLVGENGQSLRHLIEKH